MGQLGQVGLGHSTHLIADNTLIAFEAFRYLKKKKTGHKGYMALKLDMLKAYDRVQWRFLNEVLLCMGLQHKSVSLTMKRVTSISVIMVNGESGMAFYP